MELKHNPGPEFFNTLNEEGKPLKEARVKTASQNAKVLAVFFQEKKKSFHCWQVKARIIGRPLIGSIRRAIDTLYNRGFIKCTGQVMGPEGRPCYTYKFNKS